MLNKAVVTKFDVIMQSLNFAHGLPICSIVDFKVHIYLNPNLRSILGITRIDQICYVTESMEQHESTFIQTCIGTNYEVNITNFQFLW